MKFDKIIILTMVLMAILSIGAVSAQDNLSDSSVVGLADDVTQLSDISSQKSVYISPTGDDSGSGSEESPFASLDKAISSINASDNAVIYVSEGVFTGEKNTDLTINLAHTNYGGSLTIQGAGKDKSVFDANDVAQIFKSVSADTVLILKDLKFTHAKAASGSVLNGKCDLTVDNCLFEDNAATNYGILVLSSNNLKIYNSVFANNNAPNGDCDFYVSSGKDIQIINSTFINASSTYNYADASSVAVTGSQVLILNNSFYNVVGKGDASALYAKGTNNCTIKNNRFVNCTYTGTKGAILNIYDGVLIGNQFVDCTSSVGAPIYVLIEYNAKLVFDDLSIDEPSFKLTCNVTDDQGNGVITYGTVKFYIGDEKIGEAKSTNGVASLSVNKLLPNGNYTISGVYSYSAVKYDLDVTNGTLNVNIDINPMDVWVSPDGDDVNGTGTFDNPFQTIKQAIDYAISEDSYDFTVHLKDGLYNLTGDYQLSYSNVINMAIVGESYGNVKIDCAASTFLKAGQYTTMYLTNLTIFNSKGRTFDVRYLTMEYCIVDNAGSLYAQTSPSQVTLNHVTWTNSQDLKMYDPKITNCHFENVTSSQMGNIWMATVSGSDFIIIVENNTFVNMVSTSYSGYGVYYATGKLISRNNVYDSNSAGSSGVLGAGGTFVLFENETFINNKATDPSKGNYGVGEIYSTSADASIKFINTKFINNSAVNNGGVIAIYGGEFINCTFENNTAGGYGGALYVPTHTSSSYFTDIILTNVTFKNNNALNGNDIYLVEPASSSALSSNILGLNIIFNDLYTSTLLNTVRADITHESGAIISGGKVSFYLDGSYIGAAELINGIAEFDYLGFKKDGEFVLSGVYDKAPQDAKYYNGTVTVSLAPLKDNVTVYVSDLIGDDENGDGTLANPYKTIQNALLSGYQQSKVVIVRVLPGTYSGKLNTNITVSASLDISIIGDGQGVTIIDGEDKSWFLNILAGDSKVKVANMTIANITKNYVDASRYGQIPAISIEKNAVVEIDGVEFRRCHGTEGGAIYTEGALTIKNSYFFNNGDSNYGGAIKNYGTLNIYNTKFVANHAKYFSTISNDGVLFLYNSSIQDSMRVNGWTGNAMVIGGAGNLTMIDSIIFRSGKTAAELIGTGQTYANNPGFAISIGQTGHVKMINSTIDGNDISYAMGAYISNTAFGGAGSIGMFIPETLEVVNSKFLNLAAVVNCGKASYTNPQFVFDQCYLETVTAFTQSTSVAYIAKITNSYFADGTTTLTKPATAVVELNNNWWGSNDKPTYKVGTVATSPDTWLIVTLNATNSMSTAQEAYLAFKVTDGVTVSDYDDAVYPRDFALSVVNGDLDKYDGVIVNNNAFKVFGSKGSEYSITAVVDNQVLTVNGSFGILPQIEVEEVVLEAGETRFGVVVLLNGAPANGVDISAIVNGVKYNSTTGADGVALFNINVLEEGAYLLQYVIEDGVDYFGTSAYTLLQVERVNPEFNVSVDDVSAGDNPLCVLEVPDDALGSVKVYVDGDYRYEYLVRGSFGFYIYDLATGKHTVKVVYTGDAKYLPGTYETSFNVNKLASSIAVTGNNVTVGQKTNIKVTLTDGATGFVLIKINDVYYALNIASASELNVALPVGTYTVSASYNGDDTYESAVSEAINVVVKDKDPSFVQIDVEDVVAGENAVVNITVPSDATGVVSVVIDGTEVGKLAIGPEGKVQVNIPALTSGAHIVEVKYDGDAKYSASSSSKIITVSKLNAYFDVPYDFTRVAVDYYAGERGDKFYVVLKDENGNVLANKKVQIAICGPVYTVTTDEEGRAGLTINLATANRYTYALGFQGDDNYNAAPLGSTTLILNKKTTTIVASSVSFKSTAKTKTVTVKLTTTKNPYDGKVYLSAGKKITLKVNGKTYTAKADANGVAKFNIELTKKGTYNAVISFAGDQTYKASNKSIKVTIK